MISTERMNRYGDKGHPWRTPLDGLNHFVRKPLFNAALSMFV